MALRPVRHRFAAVTLAAGLAFVAPPASAQEAPADEVGIGDASSEVCSGRIAVRVVDLDGAEVGGAVITVAGQQVVGGGSVDSPCGEVGATLLTPPDGYAAAGVTSQTARVTHGAVEEVVFQVDEVEVLGVTFEQPQGPGQAPAAESASAGEPAVPSLPNTGPEDAPMLALLAGLLLALGAMLLRFSPALAAHRPTP